MKVCRRLNEPDAITFVPIIRLADIYQPFRPVILLFATGVSLHATLELSPDELGRFVLQFFTRGIKGTQHLCALVIYRYVIVMGSPDTFRSS